MKESSVGDVIEKSVEKQFDLTAEILRKGQEFISEHGMDIIQAVILLSVGYMACRWIRRLMRRVLTRSRVEPSAISFISEMIYFFCLSVVLLIALGVAGVPVATLAATFGAIGLALALGLQGNISNVASGIFILIFRPFRIGDYVAVGANEGTVRDIRIMYTEIATTGQHLIVIPNSQMTGSVIKNYSSFPTRNLEFVFDVGYDTDLPSCLDLLKKVFTESPFVIDKEGSVIYIKSMGVNSIQIYARGEVKRGEYYEAQSQLFIAVKQAFEKSGIDIPYPQVVVHHAKEST